MTKAEIPQAHLDDLKRAVETLNALVAELHERHSEHFDFGIFARFLEFEPPAVTVTIRQVFAEYGR